MTKRTLIIASLVAMLAPVAMGQAFFADDFNTGGTAGALSRGWEFVEINVTETGVNFVVAPEWPLEQDGPGTSTGFINPPTADGTESTGGYLMSDSDAAGGSDDMGSAAEVWAITPAFSTAGASEVWLHASVEIEGNNNGEAIGWVQATADGGTTWHQVWVMVEPDRPSKGFTVGVETASLIGGWPELGSASQTKTFDGVHGGWHLELPSAVVNQSAVQVRFGWYETADAWWYAIDDIVIDDNPPPMGDEVILTEDFEGGIPSTWGNASDVGNTQLWDVQPLMIFDEWEKLQNDLPVSIDILDAAAEWEVVIDFDNPDGQDGDFNPRGLLDGRWLLMLAGGNYAMWQEGEDDTQSTNLDTPTLDLSSATAAYIDFDSEVLVGNSAAVYEVQVSADGGQTFERLFTYTEALMNTEEAPYFMHHYLEAPQAAGSSNVIFRFHAAGGDPGEMEGFWVIDNVSVTADTQVAVPDWMLR